MQPKIRKAFPDTAYWVADLRTDSSGQATVKFNYPDAITSWRATTRGVTQDTKVGSTVVNTIVRKNLMVRLVVPRFFRRGDEITLSTIVQNYLPAEKTAHVSMDFTGLQVLDGGEKAVPVPSRGLVKVDYRVRVLDVDSARVLGKALTDVESDAMELTLPVVPFGVKLALAKSGSVAGAGTNDTTQSIVFPAETEAGTRKLTLSLTPSIAGTVFCGAGLPDVVSVWLHRADHVELPTRCAGRRRHEEAGREIEYRSGDAEQAGQCRVGSFVYVSTSRRRVGMVADRRQRSVHDGVCASGIEPGKGRGVCGEARGDRQGDRVAASAIRSLAEGEDRLARVYGLCTGAEWNA